MSEGRRLTPRYDGPTPHVSGPSLPYAYEESAMSQRAAMSQRVTQAQASLYAGAEHSDVLNLHQFVSNRSGADHGASADIGQRMLGGEKLRDAVKGRVGLEQQARVEAIALRGALRQ